MRNDKIKRVLIANRGEIALRIQRACQKLGIQTVTIASEVDSQALFARKADKLVIIGPAPAREFYLSIDRIITAAKEQDCDAIHPGYGFLSENAEFAQKVEEAGLCFIGPSSKSIQSLGSKTEARRLVRARGVPTTEGCAGGLTDHEIEREANRIGYPVIIKAVAGGGGRGMRIAQSAEEVRAALPLARAEALKNFSNEAVYIEQYVAEPRHVEVQVFGDKHGHVVHFGTRDCSTQRRHQKLVEEAPAPFLSAGLRAAIEHAAVEAARSVNYENAGTAEFLVKGDKFYFLEMNTRIQVEHPVTEAVTGVDLVELQLRVAQGEPLPMSQSEIRFSGHAIEFRIYAEDPSTNFAPSKGRIHKLLRPGYDFVREDHGIEEGDDVSLYYDAMLSKLIVRGETRKQAIENSIKVLREYQLEGLATTLPFHKWLLINSPFVAGPLDIGYLGRHFGPHSLRDLEASEIKDPRHREPVAQAEHREELRYTSRTYSAEYTIEVLHQDGGFFLARPINSDGVKASLRYCRRSNGFATAVKALTVEVLEKVEPGELFS